MSVHLPEPTRILLAAFFRVILLLAILLVLLPPGKPGGDARAALTWASEEEKTDVAFLLHYMPQRDRTALAAQYLLENVRYARMALHAAPWSKELPEGYYQNYILPYASITEQRDDWRRSFYHRFMPLVKDCRHPGEAAVRLNTRIYALLKVRYSATERVKPDQGPLESITVGYASCTGLSILLVDACRAVGIPARLAGVAHWTGAPGNHTWVEVWDDGWHCLGAAESTTLDQAWFTTRAAQADPTDALRCIYAVSFQRQPQYFPLTWDPSNTKISAIDVTETYHRRFSKQE
jgi:transglutaminase-like putative cysteine protease